MSDTTDIDTTDITVYHNPKCGTSRSVLALLEEHGVEHETVLYMDDKLSRDDFDNTSPNTPNTPLRYNLLHERYN